MMAGDQVQRGALVQLLLHSDRPVIVLDAVAGMGKSVLLAQLAAASGAVVHTGPNPPDPNPTDPNPPDPGPPDPGPGLYLWDMPHRGAHSDLPEAFVSGAARIILAKRPALNLPGIDRAEAYGRVLRLTSRDLAFDAAEIAELRPGQDAAALMTETGGWPLLAARTTAPDDVLVRFLQAQIMAELADADLVRLVTGRAGGGAPGLPPPAILPDRLPASIATQLQQAAEAEISARCRNIPDAIAIALAYEGVGRLPDAICAFQGAGRPDLAVDVMQRGHADFFIHIYGSAAFDRVLAGFTDDFTKQSETLMICRVMQALKRGYVALARRQIADWLGPAANDPAVVFAPQSPFSLKFRSFRLVMLIYEDVQMTDALLKLIFALLEEYPAEDHLARGSFYNAMLEFFARSRRFAEAEDLARRARHHYQLAKVPLLVFYISLHQSIVRLISGDAITSLTHAQMAAAELASVPFDSPSDQRLLTLLMACITYEGGKVEPLARFLNLDFDDFTNGEIWPNLIELALYYGSLALSQHYSTLSARSFLDRWRVYQLRNPGLTTMMDLREVMLLQNGNRWQEAAERLAGLPQRITRAWVLAQNADLTRLNDRDELAAALLWLRHMAFEGPKRPGLAEKLAQIASNPLLTARQRIGVEIWTAYCHRWQRNLSAARAGLLKTLESAGNLGAVAPLTEERPFLADLLDNTSIASFLDASTSARHVLRKMREAGTIKGSVDRSGILTRQETRILQAVCEGASNKFVAHAFGLSEATVKFHLGNVYAKLGCRGRKQAIQAAAALGLVT